MSTRKPPSQGNDDLLNDSVLGATANIYNRMKSNMEKAALRAVEKVEKKKTIRQINVRDKDHKDVFRGRGRTNTLPAANRS